MATFILATWKLMPKTKLIGWKQEISAENTAWIWFLLKPHQKMISSKNSSKEVRHQKTYVPKILALPDWNNLQCGILEAPLSFGHKFFIHPIICFLFLVAFVLGDEVTKVRKYYVIFVYILQGKMGKTEKNGKKITQLK